MRKTGMSASLALLVASFVVGQIPPPQNLKSGDKNQTPATTIRIPVDVVSLLFTVTDKKNRYVTNLEKSDFKVFEDNQEQKIDLFLRESDLPLRIAILIDASDSIKAKLKFEQEAAIEFLRTTLRPGKDEAMLVSFDTTVEMLQDFTDDIDLLSKSIRNVRAGGGTAMYDAIQRACQEKFLNLKGRFRKVIILITDGDDNQSNATRTDTLEMAQRAEVVIYAISTNASSFAADIAKGDEGRRRGERELKLFAEETGGRVLSPFSAADLDAKFEDISRDLRSQYNLTYVSTNAQRDGTFRTVKIAGLRKELRVRVRRGYYAPSDNR